MSLTIRDFIPVNQWHADVLGKKFKETDIPKYIIDSNTGRKYLNETNVTIRIKCLGLAIGTPFAHIPFGALNIAFRTVRVFSWENCCRKEGEEYDHSSRLNDGLRIIGQPFAIIGLECAAIYGIFRPHDGRKLYASLELAQYERSILAPCFHPKPEKHLLGGDINVRDAY